MKSNVLAGIAVTALLAAGLTGANASAPTAPFTSLPVTETNVDAATGGINVHQKGTVLTLPGRLANPIYPFVSPIRTNRPNIISGPDAVGTRYALSSLTFTNTFATGTIQATVYVTTNCPTTGGAIMTDVMVPPSSTLHLDFPQPLLSPSISGGPMCLGVTIFAAATRSLEMTVVGDKTT